MPRNTGNSLKRNFFNSYSKFCGHTICNDCGKKRRCNPEDKTKSEFIRICDKCEERYILKLIYDDFMNKRAA
jgi:hypothetical protein